MQLVDNVTPVARRLGKRHQTIMKRRKEGKHHLQVVANRRAWDDTGVVTALCAALRAGWAGPGHPSSSLLYCSLA